MKAKRIIAILLSLLMLLSLLPVSALAADTARTRSVTFEPADISAAIPMPETDPEPAVETVGDPVRVPLVREIPETLITPALEPAAEEAPEPVRAETHRVGRTTSEAADARRPAGEEPAAYGDPCTVSLFIQPSLDAANLMVYPSGAHYVGQTIILIALPKSGYHFVAWVNYETEEVSYNSQYSTVLQGDCEWDALFIRDGEYSIYRNKPLDMEINPNLYSYVPGTQVTLTAPPREGRSIAYEIGEETDDHTAASVTWQRIGSDGKFSMPAANTWVRGLYANNINVSCSGHGTAVLSPEGPYYEGDTVTLTLEPEAGYYASHVTGLPVGYSVSENVITFQTDYDANINIEFLPIPAASVNFGVFPSGKGTLNHSLNEETGVITAEAIPADGFTLLYWMKYDQSTGACQALSAENPYVFVPQEDMLVVAVFGFLYPAEGGAVQTVIADNGDVTMTAVPAPGYQFLFWMSIADQEIISYDAAYTTLPRMDIALAAAFQKGTRRVIPADYQPERGSFQVVNNQYYFNPGDTVALEAVPAEGYALETFLMAEYQEGVTSYQMAPVSGSSFVMPDYDVVVTATFCHLYTVSAEASPLEGGFALGSGQYKEGQAVTLTAVPNEGWRFVNWTENGSAVSTDAEYSFTASADRSLTANFEPIPTTCYTVSASANPTEGGTVSGAGEYEQGATVTLSAVPNEGWRFVNWTENGDTVSTNAAYSFTASADRSLTANFEQIPVTYYTISASANPTEGGTVTGAGQYAEAATVTLTAVPNEGWHFLNWTENGSVVSTSPIYGFIAVSNRSLTANFEPSTGQAVSYLDPTDETNPNKICEDYTLLTNQNALGTGWYVVNQDVAIYGGITVLGNVHIILCDGATLTSAQGIRVTEGTSLTLWAQSEGDGMGVLFAGTADGTDATCELGLAGIGGGLGRNGGDVTVNGGTVTATGGEYGAGIGGGFEGSGGTVTVNGGTVTAAGGMSAAGIGGGFKGNGGTVTVNGGTVTATGGRDGAGIGGGIQGNGGTVTVSGGTVTATGGRGAAGIGGAQGKNGGTFTITDGTVTATGGMHGTGIGNGQGGKGGTITISGGTVTATSSGDVCVGIGSGTVTISSGTVTATGGEYGAGISGNTVAISGGTVTATGGEYGAGISSVLMGNGGTVTITGGSVTAIAGTYGQAIAHGQSSDDSGSLTIDGMKVYASEEATEPVAAADRIDSCRGSWAKLTPCEPHNDYYVDNGETHTAVCAWCGVEGEPVSHSYGEASYTWEPDGSACSAAHSCTLCQHEQTEAGSVSAQVTLQPTCTEYGKTSYTAVFTTQGFETQTLILTNVEPFGHDLIHHDAQAPTCTEIGWEAYDACSRCDYTTYTELEALGHDLIHHDAHAPTCTEIGWEAYDACSRCDYTTYVELEALGHDLIHHDAQAPSCTEIGWAKYDTCSRCDYTTYVELEALGHDLIHHDAQAPSCTEIGWEAYDTCSRCDYTTYAGLDALGHVWEVQDYVWSEDFTTCTATAVCARDGSHIQTETVNAVFVLTKPSTFESTGTGYYAAAFENELFEAQTQEVIVPEVACAGGEDCPSGHFTDLPPITSYAHIPIDWAVVNRITGGTSPTTFGPEQSCTRAQFVMFLWCVMGRPEPAAESNPFKDVKPSDYFYKAVLWAVENGITAGTSADTFSPKMVVTRAQVVTFIWHNEGDQTAAQTENLFEDVRAGDYYHDAVLWAVERGVTAGTSATTFSPSAICTRAQCMTFLYRVYGMDG